MDSYLMSLQIINSLEKLQMQIRVNNSYEYKKSLFSIYDTWPDFNEYLPSL